MDTDTAEVFIRDGGLDVSVSASVAPSTTASVTSTISNIAEASDRILAPSQVPAGQPRDTANVPQSDLRITNICSLETSADHTPLANSTRTEDEVSTSLSASFATPQPKRHKLASSPKLPPEQETSTIDSILTQTDELIATLEMMPVSPPQETAAGLASSLRTLLAQPQLSSSGTMDQDHPTTASSQDLAPASAPPTAPSSPIPASSSALQQSGTAAHSSGDSVILEREIRSVFEASDPPEDDPDDDDEDPDDEEEFGGEEELPEDDFVEEGEDLGEEEESSGDPSDDEENPSLNYYAPHPTDTPSQAFIHRTFLSLRPQDRTILYDGDTTILHEVCVDCGSAHVTHLPAAVPIIDNPQFDPLFDKLYQQVLQYHGLTCENPWCLKAGDLASIASNDKSHVNKLMLLRWYSKYRIDAIRNIKMALPGATGLMVDEHRILQIKFQEFYQGYKNAPAPVRALFQAPPLSSLGLGVVAYNNGLTYNNFSCKVCYMDSPHYWVLYMQCRFVFSIIS